MAVTTVAKTIGSTGVFSTLQLWEDGAPADLTTAERSTATSFLVAAFVQGESLTFVGSGATGKFLDTDSTGAGNGTYVTYGITTGNPAASDVVTGGTSGATCVLSSGTPDFVGIIWQGQCQNQAFSGGSPRLTVNGSTVSSTAYKELTTVAGASFRDNANAQTNALRYNSSNGCGITGSTNSTVTITVTEQQFHISKLQVEATGSGGRGVGLTLNCFMDYCIVEARYTANSSSIGVLATTTGCVVTNSLIIQRATAADHIIAGVTGATNYYNCTICAADDLATAPLFVDRSSVDVFQNCALFAGNSASGIATGAATFTTCYSDISGTAGVTQTTYANEFQNVNDATLDLRLKAGAAEIGAGTADATHAAFDIVGTPRPQGVTYDVSAWEVVMATPSTGGGGGIIGLLGGMMRAPLSIILAARALGALKRNESMSRRRAMGILRW